MHRVSVFFVLFFLLLCQGSPVAPLQIIILLYQHPPPCLSSSTYSPARNGFFPPPYRRLMEVTPFPPDLSRFPSHYGSTILEISFFLQNLATPIPSLSPFLTPTVLKGSYAPCLRSLIKFLVVSLFFSAKCHSPGTNDSVIVYVLNLTP